MRAILFFILSCCFIKLYSQEIIFKSFIKYYDKDQNPKELDIKLYFLFKNDTTIALHSTRQYNSIKYSNTIPSIALLGLSQKVILTFTDSIKYEYNEPLIILCNRGDPDFSFNPKRLKIKKDIFYTIISSLFSYDYLQKFIIEKKVSHPRYLDYYIINEKNGVSLFHIQYKYE